MEAVLNDPVYKGRFSVNIVYLEEENSPKGLWQRLLKKIKEKPL